MHNGQPVTNSIPLYRERHIKEKGCEKLWDALAPNTPGSPGIPILSVRVTSDALRASRALVRGILSARAGPGQYITT